MLPQPGCHDHDHSFGRLVVRVNRHQVNFTGVLWAALEGQALGRGLLTRAHYMSWQNLKQNKQNQNNTTTTTKNINSYAYYICCVGSFFFFFLRSYYLLDFLTILSYFSCKPIPRYSHFWKCSVEISLIRTLKIWTYIQIMM